MRLVPLLINALTLSLLALPAMGAEDNIIFDAAFDQQANWAPQVRSQRYRWEGDTGSVSDVPENKPGKFDFYYLSESWHPSEYPGKQPVAQVTDDFPGYSGSRAFVMFDESYGGPGSWGADSVMTKDLGREYSELYLSIRIKFSPDWIWADMIEGKGQSAMKLLRCVRHSGLTTNNRFSFFGKDARSKTPSSVFNLKSWSTGSLNSVRPSVLFWGYTHPDDYKTSDDYYGFGGEYDNKVESGVKVAGDSLSWNELFLDGAWHEIGFYLKMDSQAGSGDGEIKVFIDGNQVISVDDVPWRRDGDEHVIGWNECSLGGNINNVPFDISEKHEQWYAVDTFKIYNGMPNRPNPPSNVMIE